ncbi:MAG: DUF1080 domain-containing protein [Verrucomicrobia bacterium]|jgi:hypothetical protein|nr:DUF1080 domain-containing protein [Verrucomicrobiota bacterium]|tara:strand:+ start:107 stop:1039 length:933 start_codon:yes stop_codon:yes gene_type:complete
MIRPSIFAACLLCVLGSATAENKKGGATWLDPELAAKENPDFLLQGEYTKEATGMQVIALGKGQFQASVYKGGLPGAGWDRSPIEPVKGDTAAIKKLVEGAQRAERKSPTLGQRPPADAVVLFDGKNADAWKEGKVSDGLLESGCETTQTFGSFQLHVEFRLPFKPESAAGSQDRGNSGIYTHNRYETQVLDSFGLDYDIKSWKQKPPSDPKQWCGCLYKFKLADTNMSLPPLTWQTYDITFTAATFEGEKKVKNARITVLHNGVKIHDDVELPKGTGAGGGRKEIPKGPIVLQGHGNPVRYRNLWIKEI